MVMQQVRIAIPRSHGRKVSGDIPWRTFFFSVSDTVTRGCRFLYKLAAEAAGARDVVAIFRNRVPVPSRIPRDSPFTHICATLRRENDNVFGYFS